MDSPPPLVIHSPPALKVKAVAPAVEIRYPLRLGAAWWVIVNGQKYYPSAKHMTEGEHKNQFPVAWLKTLTRDELLSLHGDAHAGEVKWEYVPGGKPCPPGAKH